MRISRLKRIRNLYDPKVVYEDYFEAYFIRPFIHHYSDFSGREPAGGLWRSLVCWGIVTLGVAGVLTGLVGLLGPETGIPLLWIVGGFWILASLLPLAALISRGSRTHTPGAEAEGRPRFLGIDALLAGICILFFVFGVLMMVTTLRSETLNPNDNYDPEAEIEVQEEESVREEPIFTYQDEGPAMTVEEPIEPEEPTEEEGEELEDSFDPTLETEATVIADSLMNL